MKLIAIAFAVALTTGGIGTAFAQNKATAKPAGGEENTTYKAKTVYDFEDDTVEGDLQRPDGELVDSMRKVKHSSLIEIRKDFIPEMLKSLEDI
jgi:hypothetical protein